MVLILLARRMYTVSLSAGVSGGIVLAGLITIKLTWRWIYYIAACLIGALTILVIFTLPETAFNRSPIQEDTELSAPSALYRDGMDHHHSDHPETLKGGIEHVEVMASGSSSALPDDEPPRKEREPFNKRLRLFHGTFTHETYWKMFARPVVLLVVPTILWGTLVCVSQFMPCARSLMS